MHKGHGGRHCCKSGRCDRYAKVEDKHLRCKSCGVKLDSCCCHDYPGHYMSVKTEQCQLEIDECCEAQTCPPVPNKYCPKQPKLPFNFFQLVPRDCHGGPKRPHDGHKKLPPLAQNRHFPHNLFKTNKPAGPSCGCSGKDAHH